MDEVYTHGHPNRSDSRTTTTRSVAGVMRPPCQPARERIAADGARVRRPSGIVCLLARVPRHWAAAIQKLIPRRRTSPGIEWASTVVWPPENGHDAAGARLRQSALSRAGTG
jgi:hypothetical protein